MLITETSSGLYSSIITITDNGPGVPEHMAEKIFEPFFTGREKGNGLGLSISRKIIESQGGSLCLDEKYTDGAKFIISIPGPEQNIDLGAAHK